MKPEDAEIHGIQLFDNLQLPSGWKFLPLGELSTIRRGASPRPAGDPRYFGDGEIPWIKIGDVTKTQGRYVGETAEHVNEEGAARSVRIPPNSLIIANSGVSLGFAAITRVEGCIHDGWLLVTELKGLDQNYLFYCINIITSRLRNYAEGTTQPNLNTGIARRILIPTPPLPEQKAIAHILGSLDDKIELNRRMNETLEGMAQALFKSWFVDFDPVIDNALEAGNPIPEEFAARAETRHKALGDGTANRESAKAFPAAFQETDEMGWIPEGWEMQPLYEMANFINGAAYKGKDFCESEEALPVIKIAEVKNGITAQTKFTEVDKGDKYKIADGEILLSWSGNPDTSIDTFIWSNGLGYLNQHIFKVSLHEECARYFVYYQLKFLRSVFAEIARDKQTTGLGHFTAGDMKRLRVFKPSSELMCLFNEGVASLYKRSFGNSIATKTLTKLRDTLLPKLISGELRVEEAEKMVGNK